MRVFFGSLLIVVASIGLASGTAVAEPLVASGSRYAFYLQGSASGNAFLGIANFDGVEETALRGSQVLTVNESETDLGNGRSRISIEIRSSADLFPVLNEIAIFGIGTFGDGLDLTRPVSLFDARVSFLDINNKYLADSGNLAHDIGQNQPWDGLFPTAEGAFGSEGIGGLGVMGMNLDFLVSEEINAVPEPAGIFLSGLGLMAMLATRRRRRR